MPEIICNTSPLQYLHQLERLHVLPALAGSVLVPPAVAEELSIGRAHGIDLPDPATLEWVRIRRPASASVLRLVTDLGRGEAEVLALALECSEPIVILDDAHARRVAEAHHIPLTGTLGLPLDAKRAGLLDAIAPALDQLEALRFRLAAETRATVLKLAGEAT